MLPITLSFLLMVAAPAAPGADDFVGRWNVRITDTGDTFSGGWIEVQKKDRALAGTIVWRWGSATPVAKTEVADGRLRLVREEQPGKQDVFEAQLDGARLAGEVRYAD